MSLKTSHSYKKVWELLPSTWWWTQLWRCEKIHSFTHTEIICSSNKYLLSTCLKTKKYHPNLLHRSSYFWLCVHLYCFLFLLLLLLYLWLTKIKLFCKTHFPFWLISFPVLQNWLFSPSLIRPILLIIIISLSISRFKTTSLNNLLSYSLLNFEWLSFLPSFHESCFLWDCQWFLKFNQVVFSLLK